MGGGEEVLGGGDDDLAVARGEQVGVDREEGECLSLRLERLGQVKVHLVPVKVRVVRSADALVKAQRSPLFCWVLLVSI